jgi:hypothetical protein
VTVPVAVPLDPETATVTEREALAAIELLAGVTVTVGVVVVGPVLPLRPPPHPIAAKLTAATNKIAPSMLLHRRDRPGMKKSRNAARTDPPVAANHPDRAGMRLPLVAAVVFTVAIDVPLVVLALRTTALPPVQVGGSVGSVTEDEVGAQVNVMVPA